MMNRQNPQKRTAPRFVIFVLPALLMVADTIRASGPAAGAVVEQGKSIPVAYDVDVVVVGGSSAAVAAACEARKCGASVFLISDRPYVGVDMCAYQRLWLEPEEKPACELVKAIFGNNRGASPLAVKKAMDEALLRAGVPYLTGCYATDVLFDGKGNVAGIAIANRSGRQAVKAKVVIDGSRHAVIARRSGAAFREFKRGSKALRFIVVGGSMQHDKKLAGRKLDVTYDSPVSGRGSVVEHPVYEYTVSVDMKDGSPASFAAAEQEVRDLVCGSGMKDCSEVPYFVPDDTVVAESRIEGAWPGAERCDISAFRPRGASRLYVLSMYADMDKTAAEEMFRPLEFMAVGRRIGREAATKAGQLPSPDKYGSSAGSADSGAAGDAGTVRENLKGLRTSKQPGTVSVGTRSLPVFGRYDVVVVGGGTSGAPAGISAARRGARTLVIEYLDELGGVGTAGLIGSYWRGNRRGFTQEINDGIAAYKKWNVIAKSEWLRRELRKYGADVWFCSFGCGALVKDGRVTGVVVATPQGRGVVLAKTVVDATGNSDIASCAGAETQFGVSRLGVLSVQLAGFPPRNLGDGYNNTCYTMVDDTDATDVWHLMTSMRIAYGGREKNRTPYDVGQLVDSRERRRTIGEYVLTTEDVLNERTHPDTISQHVSNFDAGAFPDSPMLLVQDMKGPDFRVDMPYRCLLPRGLDGILVTGLSASVERDAMTLTRMQADLQNQGYAAGMAAALAAKLDGRTREIDIKQVQKQMVEEGVLEPRVLRDTDSYPMSESAVAAAVENVKQLSRWHDQSNKIASEPMRALAVIMAHPRRSKPLLRQAYKHTSDTNERVNYAKILAVLGDNTGVPALIAEVDAKTGWDEGHPYTSGRDVGNVFSDLDRLIIALGYSRDPRALEPVLRKTAIMEPATVLSHYKAVTLALRHLRNPQAIGPLAELLEKPGFRGHAVTEPVASEYGPSRLCPRRSFDQLNAAFKEIIVAGALYQCGDHQNMGRKILEQYTQDVNGHFGSYAAAILRGEGLPERAVPEASPPLAKNFVFILADDLGARDLSGDGSTFYHSPNIDRIASEGIRFTNGYAACPVCSPSRASIMTGKYTPRHGITDWIGAAEGSDWTRNTRLLPAKYNWRLNHEDVTLAEALHEAGYKTFFAGKWHLGDKGSWPEDHGFDINIAGWDKGSPTGGYFSPYKNPNIKDGPDGESLPIRLGRETARFIEANKDRKFLAYLSFYSVHGPIQTTRQRWAKYREKATANPHEGSRFLIDRTLPVRQVQDCPIYAGMIEAMDEAVGIVLDKLEELGLDDNTVVIFTSDNGGVSSGDAYSTCNLPFRGGKGRQWEGGIREPYYIKAPGLTRPGSTCATPVIGTDFYPTILELAGLPLRPEQHVDGVSLVPLLEGGSIAPRDLFWHYPHYGNQGGEPSSIIRSGNWKLIHYWEDGRDELYDLSRDIGEQHDLSESEPGIRASLRKKLDQWIEQVGARLPMLNPRYDDKLAERQRQDTRTKQLPQLERQHAGFLDANFQPNPTWWGSTMD